MRLPLSPPTPPMLAKVEQEIPRGDGWRYEPKWDGFRSIVYRDGDDIFIESRDGRPLARYFPELLPVLSAALPERCVVDGEIVIAVESGLEFGLLQMRLHPAESRVRKLAGETPSSFVAFDLLAEGDQDLTKEPLDARRARLADALRADAPDAAGRLLPLTSQVLLTPQTADPDEAERWFFEMERLGLDGIMAKRADSPYSPGKRTMVKVKHRRTADCVVGGYRLHKSGDGVGSLLLGLYADSVVVSERVGQVMAQVPRCPYDFADELVKLVRLQRDYEINSHIVVLQFAAHPERVDMILFATRLRRRFDVQWQFGGGDRQSTGIANLMPLASELAVRGYLERMEAALKDRFGGDFETLRVRPYVISLQQHEPLAVLGRIVSGEAQ